MRKLALALLILALSAGGALALDMQARSFYVHGIFSLPSGDFGDAAGNGFGGGVGIMVPHDDRLSFRAEAGYVMFGKEEFGDFEYSYSMIPIVALAQYVFTPDTPVYGLGGVGFHNVRFDAEYTGPDSDIFGDLDDSSTEFGLTLGAGFNVNERFGVEGRYNIISDADQLTINAIIHF